MRIIGLTGRAGSGKNTVEEIIRSQVGACPGIAFADPLKGMLDVMLDMIKPHFDAGLWNDRQWKEAELPDIGKSPRQLAQTLGTEWGRHQVHPDIWLILARKELAKYESAGYETAVITDCRFENEATMIRNMNGEIWHILRPTAEPVSHHASEAGIALVPLIDSVIDNSGSLDHLREIVRQALLGQLKVEPAQRSAA